MKKINEEYIVLFVNIMLQIRKIMIYTSFFVLKAFTNRYHLSKTLPFP